MEQLLSLVDCFIQSLQSQKLDPEALDHEMLKLFYFVISEFKKNADPTQTQFLDGFRLNNGLREWTTQEDKEKFFRQQFVLLADWLLSNRGRTKHVSIERARQYIQKNFTKDLPLNEVAHYVAMNPTYFSNLFKKEIGKSYIQYITMCRLELAKILLERGLTVTEVSEKIGYLRVRHFSEVFKKYIGTYPSDYRNLKK